MDPGEKLLRGLGLSPSMLPEPRSSHPTAEETDNQAEATTKDVKPGKDVNPIKKDRPKTIIKKEFDGNKDRLFSLSDSDTDDKQPYSDKRETAFQLLPKPSILKKNGQVQNPQVEECGICELFKGQPQYAIFEHACIGGDASLTTTTPDLAPVKSKQGGRTVKFDRDPLGCERCDQRGHSEKECRKGLAFATDMPEISN